jgi:hypothetical protein
VAAEAEQFATPRVGTVLIGRLFCLHQQALDTTTPSGRPIFQVCGVFAECTSRQPGSAGVQAFLKLIPSSSRSVPTSPGDGPNGKKYQGRLDPSRLVFIDETWAKTDMTRSTHGRARRGERLVAKAPHGRRRTLTFLAALRHDRIDAPCVIDGPSTAVWHFFEPD